MAKTISPVKLQAVKDALEFVAARNKVDVNPDAFLKLVNDLTNFYNTK